MTVSFLDEAREELRRAVAYHEGQRPGLGDEFADEVENTIRRIKMFPGAWTPLSNNARRCRMKRFSYGLVYTVEGEQVLIVAVMHLHQKPGYWTHRLP